jgi:hypothetical protein
VALGGVQWLDFLKTVIPTLVWPLVVFAVFCLSREEILALLHALANKAISVKVGPVTITAGSVEDMRPVGTRERELHAPSGKPLIGPKHSTSDDE